MCERGHCGLDLQKKRRSLLECDAVTKLQFSLQHIKKEDPFIFSTHFYLAPILPVHLKRCSAPPFLKSWTEPNKRRRGGHLWLSNWLRRPNRTQSLQRFVLSLHLYFPGEQVKTHRSKHYCEQDQQTACISNSVSGTRQKKKNWSTV